LHRKFCDDEIAMLHEVLIKIFRVFVELMSKDGFLRIRTLLEKSAKSLSAEIDLYRSFQARSNYFNVQINSEAESVGRLDQKFFGRRVETISSSPLPQSRVFSKNL
jgi:hypothetical protein